MFSIGFRFRLFLRIRRPAICGTTSPYMLPLGTPSLLKFINAPSAHAGVRIHVSLSRTSVNGELAVYGFGYGRVKSQTQPAVDDNTCTTLKTKGSAVARCDAIFVACHGFGIVGLLCRPHVGVTAVGITLFGFCLRSVCPRATTLTLRSWWVGQPGWCLAFPFFSGSWQAVAVLLHFRRLV
jgi:hypothetical protein